MSITSLKQLAFTFYLLCLSPVLTAAQLDIMPDDYVVKPDTTLMTINWLDRTQTGPYLNGVKISNASVNSSVYSLKIGRFMQRGNYTFAPSILVSYRDIQTEPATWQRLIGKEASGIRGDASLGGTIWLVNDQEKQEFVATTLYATLPTGEYDPHQIINLSENRWKIMLGGAWVKPLNERWINELYPEVAWYGDNKEYKDYRQLKYLINPTRAGDDVLSQDMSVALTDTIRYKITPQWQAYLTTQLNWGSKTYVNDKVLSEAPQNTRMSIGGLYYTPAGNQWLVRYSRDMDIDNGFRNTSEYTIRYLHYF